MKNFMKRNISMARNYKCVEVLKRRGYNAHNVKIACLFEVPHEAVFHLIIKLKWIFLLRVFKLAISVSGSVMLMLPLKYIFGT